MDNSRVAFIGGGNMASALIGGFLKNGRPASAVCVVEPSEAQRAQLQQRFGVAAHAAAGVELRHAATVVWAVKPQLFAAAAAPVAAFVGGALQLSVMAGIRCAAVERAVGASAVVRAMPNTPALIGQGIAGLYAQPAVTPAQRGEAHALLAPTGALLWLAREEDLDAVTALSGSGPAYMFYLLEAMMQAAVDMGLSADQGRTLALATMAGSAALAQGSAEPPAALRAQVTSPGGTTHAALSSLEADGVKAAIVKALRAAQARARELGDALG
jgi:pyrroline-5-carboxylate reductase